MKMKLQIGCALLAASMFIFVVWFTLNWFAPVDIEVPPRQYPPGNVYPVYKELARKTKAFADGDPEYKRGMELIADQISFKPKKPALSDEEKKAIAYVTLKFEPIRRDYTQLNTKPCVAVFDYDVNWLFPELAQFRQWARLESYLMQQYLKEGGRQDAIQCYNNILRLSEQINREGVIIHCLVGIALRTIIQAHLGDYLQEFSAQECGRIVEITREWLQTRFPLVSTLEYEKHYGISIYRKLHSGEITIEDLLPDDKSPSKFQLARLFNLRAGAREYAEYMSQLSSEYQKPYGQHRQIPLPQHIVNQIIVPVFEQAYSNYLRSEAISRLIGCAAAVRAYKLRHGRYPKTLAEAGVQDLNYDPYSGEDFIYKTDPSKGFLIYSVFFNGVDNGGKRPHANRDIPNTDLSPVYYRDPSGRSPDTAPPGPPAWLK